MTTPDTLSAADRGSGGLARDKPKREAFQAGAVGQGTPMGRTFSVTFDIAEHSTREERRVLVEAFDKAGSEGPFNALEKMSSKGRIDEVGVAGLFSR